MQMIYCYLYIYIYIYIENIVGYLYIYEIITQNIMQILCK